MNALVQIDRLEAVEVKLRNRPWTSDPVAVKLIQSCARRVPPSKLIRHTYAITTDEYMRYDDDRVEALELIRSREGNKLLYACDARFAATGDREASYEPMETHFKLTVEKALTDAIRRHRNKTAGLVPVTARGA